MYIGTRSTNRCLIFLALLPSGTQFGSGAVKDLRVPVHGTECQLGVDAWSLFSRVRAA